MIALAAVLIVVGVLAFTVSMHELVQALEDSGAKSKPGVLRVGIVARGTNLRRIQRYRNARFEVRAETLEIWGTNMDDSPRHDFYAAGMWRWIEDRTSEAS